MTNDLKLSVYGSSGFIGSNFCNLYQDQIIKIPRNEISPQTKDILYFISTIHNYNVLDNPHLDIETNLTVLIKVLEECKKKEIDTFNFISSWFVYGKCDDLPAKETSYCNPKGFYSITKRSAEQLLISYCETFGINYRILRLCNVIGDYDSKSSIKKNAIQYMIEELYKGNDINLYDNGENIRDFMYVSDVSRAIKLCIDKSPKNSITNIGSGHPHKIKELMIYSKEKLNSGGNFINVDPPEFHKIVQVKDMFLDNTKLKNLGFKEKSNIYESIDRIIENIRKNH